MDNITISLDYFSSWKHNWIDTQIKRILAKRYYKNFYIGRNDKVSYTYKDYICSGTLHRHKDGATFEFAFDTIAKTMLSIRIN